MSRTKKAKPSYDRVVLVGLVTSRGNAPEWRISFAKYHQQFLGRTLSDVNVNSEFSDFFEEPECVETHAPDKVADAISKAIEIAKSHQLPLYRVTDTRPYWNCRIYEEF